MVSRTVNTLQKLPMVTDIGHQEVKIGTSQSKKDTLVQRRSSRHSKEDTHDKSCPNNPRLSLRPIRLVKYLLHKILPPLKPRKLLLPSQNSNPLVPHRLGLRDDVVVLADLAVARDHPP